MSARCTRLLGFVAALTIYLIAPAASTAQTGRNAEPTGPPPRTSDGKVDLAGVWHPGTSFGNIGQVPLQPWAEALRQDRRANLSKDDPEGHCLPAGVPRISPFPYKIVQTPTLIVYLDEGNVHSYRQFFMDGRDHPKDADQLWMGHSIAKWEGDTLVVDTIGFNEKTWLNGGGIPHTDRLHVVERFTRLDYGRLEIEITIDDSGAFKQPHTFKRVHTLMPGAELLEYVCNEFNIDKDRLVGNK